MAAVTCIRCFAVFQSEDARPGVAPVCAACIPAVGSAPSPRVAAVAARRAPRWHLPLRKLAVVAAGLVLGTALAIGATVAVRALLPRVAGTVHRPAQPQPGAPRAVDEALAAWRKAGNLPPAVAGGKRSAGEAAERVAAGRAALASGRPARLDEALSAFQQALALDPDGAEATAGYVIALVERGVDRLDGEDLARAHGLVQEALAARPGHPQLLAAYARLLLAVPSERNLAEARGVLSRARAADASDVEVLLAAGLAQTRTDPPSGARELAAAAARNAADRRLLGAAAAAAWQAGDASGALSLARARLAQDPDDPGALALSAEVLAAMDRPDEARAALARWAQAVPTAAEPLLLEARLRHQLDRDLVAARRLLAGAMARHPDELLAARILAHRAAVERQAGDPGAASAAIAEGLRHAPASAPLQFQVALLAFEVHDPSSFRRAVEVLGDRAGPDVTAWLAALGHEVAEEPEEAARGYQELAGRVRDPAALLELAGALVRVGRRGAAIEVARQALRRDLADARLSRVPTEFWEGPSELSAAAEVFRQLADGDPRVASAALSAAAACELLLGHSREAELAARGAESADPQARAPRWLQAQLALDLAQPARALPLARAAAEGLDDPAATATLGRALEATGKLEDAAHAYRKALAAAPDLIAARVALARLLARKGDAAGGRALLAELPRAARDVPAARRALLELGGP